MPADPDLPGPAPAAYDDPTDRPADLAVAAHLHAAGDSEGAMALALRIAAALLRPTIYVTADKSVRPSPSYAHAAALLLAATAARAAGEARTFEVVLDPAEAPPRLRDLLPDHYLHAHATRHLVACGYLSSADAERSWEKLLHDHPASLLAARARWGLARSYSAGLSAKAIPLLTGLLSARPDWLERDEARMLLARAHEAKKDSKTARAVLLALYLELPRSRFAAEAKKLLSTPDPSAFEKLLTPARRLERAEALLGARLPEEACPEIEAVWAGAPKPPLDLRAGALRARCLIALTKDYGAAGALREELSARARKRGDLGAAADHLFEAAKAHGGKHKGEEHPERAIVLYDRFISEFPADKRVPVARFFAAYGLFTIDHREEAIARFDAFAGEHPDDERAGDARWYGAWARWMAGDAEAALVRFAVIAKTAGADARKGAYWHARALEARGDAASATAARKIWRSIADRDPFGWYGLLSRVRLVALGERDAPFALLVPPPPGIRPPPAEDPIGDAAWRFVLLGETGASAALPPGATVAPARRALALLAVGLRPEAAAELRASRAAIEKAGGRGAVLDLLAAAEDHATTRRLAASAAGLAKAPTGVARRDWSLAYPIAFEREVDAAAAAHGVPRSFLLAIMHKESGFDPRAVSYADAVGLMQLLPKTGRKIAARRGLAFADDRVLFNPGTNVDYAGWYLGQLLADFKGQLPLAAGAYNGGPLPMKRWLDAFGTRPLDELVESVTYAQSREYIKRVSALYARYVYLYEAGLWLPGSKVGAAYGTGIDF